MLVNVNKLADITKVSKRTIYRHLQPVKPGMFEVDNIIEDLLKSKDKLLTVIEVAKLFNCTKSTIYRFCDEYKLKEIRIFGSVRFLESHIREVLKNAFI